MKWLLRIIFQDRSITTREFDDKNDLQEQLDELKTPNCQAVRFEIYCLEAVTERVTVWQTKPIQRTES